LDPACVVTFARNYPAMLLHKGGGSFPGSNGRSRAKLHPNPQASEPSLSQPEPRRSMEDEDAEFSSFTHKPHNPIQLSGVGQRDLSFCSYSTVPYYSGLG